MSFNENLKRIRKEKYTGTVKSFAEDVLKISYKTYHGYESKNALPPEGAIIKIAEALNVSIDELFGIKKPIEEKQITEKIEVEKNEVEEKNPLENAESTVKELNEIGFAAAYNKENDSISFGEKSINITIPCEGFNKILNNCKEAAYKKYEPIITQTAYAKIMCHLMDIQTQEMLTPKIK